MIRLFHYTITLLDAVYYAREGLAGAVAPPILHATAINGALAAATNDHPEGQPFLTAEFNGGANRPRYADSRLTDTFYATPAAPMGTVRYRIEIAKGESDGFLEIHLRDRTPTRPRVDYREQPLRFRKLHFLAPEMRFRGFLFLRNEAWPPPSLIRLGSFRAPARVEWLEASRWERLSGPHVADHPVDPLVSGVTRGMMVNMLPYGVVENATTTAAARVFFKRPPVAGGRREFIVAWPDGFEEQRPATLRVRDGTALV